MVSKQTYKELEERVKELEKKVISLKGVEKTLLKSKRGWEETFDALGDWISIVDLDYRIRLSNRAGEKMLGLSRDEIVGGTCYRVFHGENTPIMDCPFQTMINSRQRETIELELRDGSWKIISVDPMLDHNGDLFGAIQIVRDITEHKKMERDLARWKTLFKHAPWGIAISENRKTVHGMNPAFAKIHGFTMEELINTHIADMFVPEVRSEVPKHIEKAYAKGNHTFESKHIRKDGSDFFCRIDLTAVKDKKGDPLFHVAHVHDITDRKKKEQDLINSEKKYRVIFEDASEGIFLLDDNGVIIDVNSQMLYFLGYDRHDIIGMFVIDLIHPDDLKTTPFRFFEIVRGKTVRVERRIRKKDSNFIVLEVSARRISDDIILALYRDTTERKKAENTLRLSKERLRRQAHTLKETNKALSLLLDHRAEEKFRFESNMLNNIKKLIMPYLEQIKKTKEKRGVLDYLSIVERNLNEITSAFSTELTSKQIYLTQTEIQIANLIKIGKTSKEIAPLLNVTPKTVFFHRENIRKKLGLTHRKINLRSYLQTIL